MTTREPPPTRSQVKHRAILDAAAVEFRTSGYQGTSMDRIAERAQVSKRTVYNHFPSKDDLFRAIVGEVWTSACAASARPFRRELPLQHQLAEIARAEMDLLSQSEFLELARALAAASLQAPDLAGPILEELSTLDTGVVTWIRAARDHGSLSVANPEMAGEQFMALIKAFAFWPQVLLGRPPLAATEAEAVVASAVEVFLSAYGT